jgi:hypothetical protein
LPLEQTTSCRCYVRSTTLLTGLQLAALFCIDTGFISSDASALRSLCLSEMGFAHSLLTDDQVDWCIARYVAERVKPDPASLH